TERILDAVRRSLREGQVEIDLRGYSHVFVTDSDQGVSSDQEALPEGCGPNSLQEVFALDQLRQLLRNLVAKAELSTVRSNLGPETPWRRVSWRAPAARPSWLQRKSTPEAPLVAKADPPISEELEPVPLRDTPASSVPAGASSLS